VEIEPRHSPGPPPARARPTPAAGWPEFGRSRAGRPPKGHIAKPQLIPGGFVQGKGLFVNLQKIQGA
jgi:hypothetical protein